MGRDGQSDGRDQRQPDEIPADQVTAARSPIPRRRPPAVARQGLLNEAPQQPIHTDSAVLADLPDTGNQACNGPDFSAALPVQAPSLGITTPAQWRDYFSHYDEFNVPIPGSGWDQWSTKLLQAYREQRV